LKNNSFTRLLASQGVSVSGKMENGKIVQIVAHSPEDKEWTFRMPQSLAKDAKLNRSLTSSSTVGKYAVVKVKLKRGDNTLTE
jgi:hypothetical protein